MFCFQIALLFTMQATAAAATPAVETESMAPRKRESTTPLTFLHDMVKMVNFESEIPLPNPPTGGSDTQRVKQHDLFTLVHGAHEVVEGDLTGRGCIYEAPDKVRLTTAKSRNAGDKAARALAKRAK